MTEADELDFANVELEVVKDWIAEVMALADAVTDKGIVDDGPDVPDGFAEYIDVGVEAEEIELGVELGVAEYAVVEGGTGVEVLEGGGTATGDVLVAGGLGGLDVLDSGGW